MTTAKNRKQSPRQVFDAVVPSVKTKAAPTTDAGAKYYRGALVKPREARRPE
jgi:hypothetical protein